MNALRLLPLLLLTSFCLQAQQLSLYTQYREHAPLINPAAVETDFLAFAQNLSVGVSYRAQWTGISGAPRTQTARITYINGEGSGVTLMAGGQLINDQTGPTGYTGLYGRIAGVLTDDAEYGGLSIGLTGGIVNYRVRSSEIVLREEGDVVGTADQSQFFPDVGVGIYFYRMLDGGLFDGNMFYAGLSVPQVMGLDLTFKNDNGEFLTKRIQHFYGMLGMMAFFDNDSYLEPSVWVKYAPNAPISADINLRYQLPTSFWIGAGGSLAGTMHLETGLLLGENVGFDNTVRIGYGFDYSFNTIGPTAGSTHEIGLGISFYTY